MMDRNLECLDVNMLKSLYERETDDLNEALLNGVSWNDLKDQRKKVTDIAMALQAIRTREDFMKENPAERSIRSLE